MKVSDIEVGKCYVTTKNQVRHVLGIQDGEVKYAYRGSKYQKDKWWETADTESVDIDKFVADISKEVACNWDKNYPVS